MKGKLGCRLLARLVKGVRVLVDEIEVRLPDAQKRHDDEIGKRVADIISWFGCILPHALR